MADPSEQCFQHMESFQPQEIMIELQMKIKSHKTKKDINHTIHKRKYGALN
jgi:predicted nucleic acid-binding protein